jgi:GNAT superfamily N-acetyltransferase
LNWLKKLPVTELNVKIEPVKNRILALNSAHLEIEPLTPYDLDAAASLQPDGWPDIFPSIEYYCKSDFCFPLKATLAGKIVGIGTAIIHGYTAWLAHIIVSPDHRNVGIGSAITKALIDLGQRNSCLSLLLIATTLGEPVYKKLGFEVETKYLFFDNGISLSPEPLPEISTFQSAHEKALFELDRFISGEDRRKLLREHFNNTIVFVENNLLKGFYIPTLGEGLIIADSPAAGLALMKLRMASTKKFCVPLLNENALNFLSQNGYAEYRRASRMILGEKVIWDGSKIYSRIGGNLG